MKKSTKERFFEKVQVGAPDECWLWTGTKNPAGYGKFKVEGKWMAAHRLSYMWNTGPIPNGLIILHRCDTPACIRPDHLYAGDYTRNRKDFLERGPKGPRKKLTPEDVREIRRLKGTMTQVKIAQMFGVLPQAISDIHSRRRWAWLEAA